MTAILVGVVTKVVRYQCHTLAHVESMIGWEIEATAEASECHIRYNRTKFDMS